jgi:ACT domain-containing protein
MTSHVQPLLDLSPGARADLLRVLMSPSNVRADVVRQFHERDDKGMVEVLVELEADELLRFQVIAQLEESL